MASDASTPRGPCDYGRGLVMCEGWLHKLRSAASKRRRPPPASSRYSAGPDDPSVLESSAPGLFDALLSWQRRYVTIEGPWLCYYAKAPEAGVGGSYHPPPSFRGDLRRALDVALEGAHVRESASLCVRWEGKVLVLRAADARGAQKWVRTLRSHVDAWRAKAARALAAAAVGNTMRVRDVPAAASAASSAAGVGLHGAPTVSESTRRLAWGDTAATSTTTHVYAAPPSDSSPRVSRDTWLNRTLSTAALYARMRPRAPSPVRTYTTGHSVGITSGGESGSSGSQTTTMNVRTHEIVETVAPEPVSPETVTPAPADYTGKQSRARRGSTGPPPALVEARVEVEHPAAVPAASPAPAPASGRVTETATGDAMGASGELTFSASHMSLAVVSTSRGGSAQYATPHAQ